MDECQGLCGVGAWLGVRKDHGGDDPTRVSGCDTLWDTLGDISSSEMDSVWSTDLIVQGFMQAWSSLRFSSYSVLTSGKYMIVALLDTNQAVLHVIPTAHQRLQISLRMTS